ncbi:MAG: type II toxin-antitoxin system RelE/ParE family toxin [Verrucomicrobia bacterium]|nr:MAG: type II toxin-antitoxin system RelE/ParE family toxin [Verrucomicrobiota bacterium]
MKLVFSPAAVQDLQLIADYTSRTWGAQQETLYLKERWAKLDLMLDRPENYRPRHDLDIDCYSERYGKHVIFFSVLGETLQVIRILHSAMDFSVHLFEDPEP